MDLDAVDAASPLRRTLALLQPTLAEMATEFEIKNSLALALLQPNWLGTYVT